MRLSLLLAATFALGNASAQNAINVSWGDNIVIYEGQAKLDTPERIAACMDDWQRLGSVETVYWRASSWRLANYMKPRHDSFPRYFDEVKRIWDQFNPFEVAAREAHARGMRLYAYQTIFDEGSPESVKYGDSTPFPWQSFFTIAHPEYLVTDREGKQRQWGVMEYAYTEVREYMLAGMCRLIDEHDFDGLYVCTRTHSRPAESADQLGFNEPVVEAYRAKYGVDILTEQFDAQKWRDLRGEFVTQFLRELRAAMKERGKRLAVAIPRGDIVGPPYGNMTLDWRTWVSEGLVDELVVGPTSGSWHYPSMKDKDRERGYLASQDEGWGAPSVDQIIDDLHGPLCEEHGVRLLVPGGWGSRTARERIEASPLSGYALNASSFVSRPGYIVVPHDPRLDFADGVLTVECWLKYEGEAAFGRVLSKYNHNLGDEGRGWEVYIDKEGHIVWRLNDGETDRAITSDATVPVGQWFHLACVSEGEGGEMKVYIDGQQDPVTRAAPSALRRVREDLYIGRYGGGGVWLNAWVDEVMLSSVARLYDGPRTGPPQADESTVALWRFDEEAVEVTSEVGEPPLIGEVMKPEAQERGEGPPGCGRAIDLTPQK